MSEPGVTRPMTPADYLDGKPVQGGGPDHPTRDLLIGAVVGAAALWLVPRILDRTLGNFFGGNDGEPEEYDLEYEE